jgi:hypothetical protein
MPASKLHAQAMQMSAAVRAARSAHRRRTISSEACT